jgi:uncharacterized integral membrane protein
VNLLCLSLQILQWYNFKELFWQYTECPRRKVNVLGGHSIGHSTQKLYKYTCPSLVSEIELFHCTVPILLIRMRYYILFLIPVFIVQVTKSVQFTKYNTFSKMPLSLSLHFATHVKTWRVACLSASRHYFSSVHFTLHRIPQTISNGLRPGDLGGQLMVLPWPIYRLGKVSLRCCTTSWV